MILKNGKKKLNEKTYYREQINIHMILVSFGESIYTGKLLWMKLKRVKAMY